MIRPYRCDVLVDGRSLSIAVLIRVGEVLLVIG
jgi:hypothetical protein